MSLLIKNVAIADVLEDKIKTGDIYIRNGRFEKTAEHIDASEIEEKEHLTVINGEGLTALPGLIDAHTHVELSMLSSASFAEALMQNGTTAAVLDPHDAVNVLGHKFDCLKRLHTFFHNLRQCIVHMSMLCHIFCCNTAIGRK